MCLLYKYINSILPKSFGNAQVFFGLLTRQHTQIELHKVTKSALADWTFKKGKVVGLQVFQV